MYSMQAVDCSPDVGTVLYDRPFMKIAILVLTLAGLAGLAFGYWGIYTPEGNRQFDEMDGLYPYFAALGGGLSLFIALILLIVAAKRPRKQPISQPVKVDIDMTGKPKFTRYSHYLLMVVPVVLFLLFEILCRMTLEVGGFEVLGYWMENGTDHWILFIALFIVLFIYSLLVVSSLSVPYALHFGIEDTYVSLGKDLHNNIFYYDFSDAKKEPLTAPGSLHEQSEWFFDRFGDLQKETVIQYGHRPEDVMNADAFGIPAAIFAVIVQWFFLFALILIGYSVFGTYLEGVTLESENYRGESPFVTTISWLWENHNTGFVVMLAVLFGLTFLAIFSTYRNQKSIEKKFKTEILEHCPGRIAAGEKIMGTITDYAIEKKSKNQSSSLSNTHYNLLVQFKNIYTTPIWLRLSLYGNTKNEEWMTRVRDKGRVKQSFVIQEDLSIWPDDLKPDDI